jgi:transmembrane anterior posterior transformation protein 1
MPFKAARERDGGPAQALPNPTDPRMQNTGIRHPPELHETPLLHVKRMVKRARAEEGAEGRHAATAGNRDVSMQRTMTWSHFPAFQLEQSKGEALLAEQNAPPSVPLDACSALFRSFSWGYARPSEVREKELEADYGVPLALQVPVELEQLLWLGLASSLDYLLHVFTLLPFRLLTATVHAVILVVDAVRTKQWDAGRRFEPLGVYMFDLLRGITIGLTVFALSFFDVSRLYHGIRGESAPIKLYVLFNILEIAERLLASTGQDILATFHRATLTMSFRSDSISRSLASRLCGSNARGWAEVLSFSGQVLGAVVITALHSAVMFVQILCLSVALNSHSNALLVLLVSNNFAELKSSVFKKYDAVNMFQIACADIVERFNLFLFMVLNLVQGVAESSEMEDLYVGVAMVLATEVVVDWVKHYFLCKFNGLSPDLYHEAAAVLSYDSVTSRQFHRLRPDPTHSPARRIGLSTMPLACVIIRFMYMRFGGFALARLSTTSGQVVALSLWIFLVCFKLALNTAVLAYSARYQSLHDEMETAAEAAGAANELTPLDTAALAGGKASEEPLTAAPENDASRIRAFQSAQSTPFIFGPEPRHDEFPPSGTFEPPSITLPPPDPKAQSLSNAEAHPKSTASPALLSTPNLRPQQDVFLSTAALLAQRKRQLRSHSKEVPRHRSHGRSSSAGTSRPSASFPASPARLVPSTHNFAPPPESERPRETASLEHEEDPEQSSRLLRMLRTSRFEIAPGSKQVPQ